MGASFGRKTFPRSDTVSGTIDVDLLVLQCHHMRQNNIVFPEMHAGAPYHSMDLAMPSQEAIDITSTFNLKHEPLHFKGSGI